MKRAAVGSEFWSNGDQSKEVTATSRRLHVATLQRRDVSSRSAPYHLKYEWFRNQGIGRCTNKGTEFQSRRERRRLRGSARASYCFSISLDTRIMFFILNTFIVSFIMF